MANIFSYTMFGHISENEKQKYNSSSELYTELPFKLKL